MTLAALSAKRCKVCKERIIGVYVETDKPVCLRCYLEAQWSDVEAEPTTSPVVLWRDASTRIRRVRRQPELPRRIRIVEGCGTIYHVGHVTRSGNMACESCKGTWPKQQVELEEAS